MRRLIFLVLILQYMPVIADEVEVPSFAMGIMLRSAQTPYVTNPEHERMDSLVPMLYYEGERYYMRGLHAGLHLYKSDLFECNAQTALRFVDMPRNDANFFSNDTFDSGLLLRWHAIQTTFEMSALVDTHNNSSLLARLEHSWHVGATQITPNVALRWQSAAYSSYYYGFGQSLDASYSMQAGLTLQHPVTSHVAIFANVQVSQEAASIREQPLVKEQHNSAVQLGVLLGDFEPIQHSRSAHQSFRISLAQATFSSFSELLTLNFQPDPYQNRFAALAYDYEISQTFLGYALSVYLHSVLASHFSSEVQQPALEFVSAFKLVHYFTYPFHGRIGIAEGLSYVSEPTYVERTVNENDGYARSSNLLNFLELSIEYQLVESLYIGYALHHRSGVFESVQSFNQIKGGSNYHSMSLAIDF